MNNRVTRGANFNLTRPEDVELLAYLDSVENQSELIKAAVRAFMRGEIPARQDAGDDPAPTRQERNELLATIASLRQQLETAEQRAAAASPGEYQQFKENVLEPAHTAAQQAREEGVQLSPAFLAGVRKIAKPGIRLDP